MKSTKASVLTMSCGNNEQQATHKVLVEPEDGAAHALQQDDDVDDGVAAVASAFAESLLGLCTRTSGNPESELVLDVSPPRTTLEPATSTSPLSLPLSKPARAFRKRRRSAAIGEFDFESPPVALPPTPPRSLTDDVNSEGNIASIHCIAATRMHAFLFLRDWLVYANCVFYTNGPRPMLGATVMLCII
ncbi:hypothetical protein LSAT2_020489 [Lamellibrachia satsuma]|nr:hypothetical protein LSAT2_020489 [Lamellibrachia satsuma]